VNRQSIWPEDRYWHFSAIQDPVAPYSEVDEHAADYQPAPCLEEGRRCIAPPPEVLWSAGNGLKFDGHPECREVPFEPVLCVELLIVTKIENYRSVHQQGGVNDLRSYAKNAAFEWTKLGT
jgi:hypothetical protein